MDARSFFLLNVGEGGGTAPTVGRITPLGPYFVDAAGQIVIRKSLTAFCAPKRYAEGRIADVRRYLDFAAACGFNEVRVFTQVNWTGPPGPGVESGWDYDESACEQLLVDAAERGLRVELVAHTFTYGLDAMVAHLRTVDALCLRYDNALLEVMNEPQQNGDVAPLLARYTPQTPGWASGVYTPTPYPAGQSVTYHSPRKDAWSRCTKDAIEFRDGSGPTEKFQPGYLGPVMLDEPPQVEQTIRDQDNPQCWSAADDWAAYGAGCAFFGCGGTMHGNPDFQKCIVPSNPSVLNCIDAFLAGFGDVPVQAYTGYGRGDPPTPSNEGSRRYFRDGADGGRYELCIRPFSFRRL